MNLKELYKPLPSIIFAISLGVGCIYLDYSIWILFGLLLASFTIGTLVYEMGLITFRSNITNILGVIVTIYVISLVTTTTEVTQYFHMLVIVGSSIWLGWTGEYRYQNGMQPFQKYDWWPQNPLLWFLVPYYYYRHTKNNS